MPYEIDISLQSPRWQSAFQEIEKTTRDTLSSVLKNTLPNHKDVEVSIVLADDAFIKDLNSTYRHKDKPTNVLSFPMTEVDDLKQPGFLSLGDIIIAYETIEREAKEQNKTLQDHFTHMLVHGCLHLLHFDHENDHDAGIMEDHEIAILRGMNIKNPYES